MNLQTTIPLIQAVAAQLRDMLGEDFDTETFLDTLDGETDALDLIDRLIAEALDAEALSDALEAQEAAMRARRDRLKAKGDAMRKALLAVLDATGEKKVQRPRATVSRRAGTWRVEIYDPDVIPSQLRTVKQVVTPDRRAIKAMLDDGEPVPGAELVRGPDGITVRVK